MPKRGVVIVGTGLFARFHAQAVNASENWKLLKPLDKGVRPFDGGSGLSDFEKRKIKRA